MLELQNKNVTDRLISDCVFVVFLPDHPGIDNTPQIERFQEKAYMELQDYVTRTYPEDSYRLVVFTTFHCWRGSDLQMKNYSIFRRKDLRC